MYESIKTLSSDIAILIKQSPRAPYSGISFSNVEAEDIDVLIKNTPSPTRSSLSVYLETTKFDVLSLEVLVGNYIAGNFAKVLVDGVWRTAENIYVLISGEWKTAESMKILVEGVWKDAEAV